jgi:hypothetical protein
MARMVQGAELPLLQWRCKIRWAQLRAVALVYLARVPKEARPRVQTAVNLGLGREQEQGQAQEQGLEKGVVVDFVSLFLPPTLRAAELALQHTACEVLVPSAPSVLSFHPLSLAQSVAVEEELELELEQEQEEEVVVFQWQEALSQKRRQTWRMCCLDVSASVAWEIVSRVSRRPRLYPSLWRVCISRVMRDVNLETSLPSCLGELELELEQGC